MRITLLCENQTSNTNLETCSSEWGLSVFIQTKNANILFDTGHTDIYLKNAKSLNIDLNSTDFIVFSHHHWDHAKGLLNHNFKDRKKLIFHPDVLRNIPEEDKETYEHDFEIVESKKPLELIDGVYFLGEIPRKSSFEKGTFNGQEILDDSALAIKSKNGVIVITGCSHSGISNICEYAKEVTGQKLYSVIGGFHLSEADSEAIEGVIKYFKKEKPEKLYPMHCVDFPTLVRFYNEFKIVKYSAGDIIEIDDK